MKIDNFKLAIVHDWLPYMAGAERVLESMHETFPEAPIYTTFFNKDRLSKKLKSANIIPTHLHKTGKTITNYRNLFPFMPVAMEHFRLTGYDIVLSCSSSVAKCVITSPDTMHICYCNSPMRYGWEFMRDYIGPLSGKGALKSKAKAYLMSVARVWDFASSARVDVFVANSVNVAKRIRKHYRRDDVFVIHPPIREDWFEASDVDGGFYLCVSRLQEYKRVDIAVRACSEMALPLVVIGDGPERKNIESVAGPSVKFLGHTSDETVREHYSRCKALLFPGEEDFGLTPLEAMASGRPVIAYGKGGALETVVDGKTGILFGEQTTESLSKAIRTFESAKFDKKVLRDHALEFGESVFQDRLRRFVSEQHELFGQRILEDISVFK
jgi:glycosyltransferase involved in cell wall biosynthesis